MWGLILLLLVLVRIEYLSCASSYWGASLTRLLLALVRCCFFFFYNPHARFCGEFVFCSFVFNTLCAVVFVRKKSLTAYDSFLFYFREKCLLHTSCFVYIYIHKFLLLASCKFWRIDFSHATCLSFTQYRVVSVREKFLLHVS